MGAFHWNHPDLEDSSVYTIDEMRRHEVRFAEQSFD